MEMSKQMFVLAIIALSLIAWIITTAIRARHGYPIENEWGGLSRKDSSEADAELKRQNALLERENELLRGKIGRIEERMAVLERIATDPARRLSGEIETLR